VDKTLLVGAAGELESTDAMRPFDEGQIAPGIMHKVAFIPLVNPDGTLPRSEEAASAGFLSAEELLLGQSEA
jgi:hypothetical protein